MIKILLKPKIDQNTPYTKKMIEILPKPKNWTKMTKMSIFRFKGVFKGLFSELTHVLSVGLVTLLARVVFKELHPELNIGPRGPMATDVFLSLQNH